MQPIFWFFPVLLTILRANYSEPNSENITLIIPFDPKKVEQTLKNVEATISNQPIPKNVTEVAVHQMQILVENTDLVESEKSVQETIKEQTQEIILPPTQKRENLNSLFPNTKKSLIEFDLYPSKYYYQKVYNSSLPWLIVIYSHRCGNSVNYAYQLEDFLQNQMNYDQNLNFSSNNNIVNIDWFRYFNLGVVDCIHKKYNQNVKNEICRLQVCKKYYEEDTCHLAYPKLKYVPPFYARTKENIEAVRMSNMSRSSFLKKSWLSRFLAFFWNNSTLVHEGPEMPKPVLEYDLSDSYARQFLTGSKNQSAIDDSSNFERKTRYVAIIRRDPALPEKMSVDSEIDGGDDVDFLQLMINLAHYRGIQFLRISEEIKTNSSQSTENQSRKKRSSDNEIDDEYMKSTVIDLYDYCFGYIRLTTSEFLNILPTLPDVEALPFSSIITHPYKYQTKPSFNECQFYQNTHKTLSLFDRNNYKILESFDQMFMFPTAVTYSDTEMLESNRTEKNKFSDSHKWESALPTEAVVLPEIDQGRDLLNVDDKLTIQKGQSFQGDSAGLGTSAKIFRALKSGVLLFIMVCLIITSIYFAFKIYQALAQRNSVFAEWNCSTQFCQILLSYFYLNNSEEDQPKSNKEIDQDQIKKFNDDDEKQNSTIIDLPSNSNSSCLDRLTGSLSEQESNLNKVEILSTTTQDSSRNGSNAAENEKMLSK